METALTVQTAIADTHQQAFLRQTLHGLPQRAPAHAEFTGELGLAELRPRGHLAACDRVSQLAGDDRGSGLLHDRFQ